MSLNSTISGTSGIINFWTLGDAVGSSTAADSIGSYPLTPSAVTFGSAGLDGTAASFNGSSSYLHATPTSTVNAPFTLEAWVKCLATGNNVFFGTRNSDNRVDFSVTTGNTIHGDLGNGSSWLSTLANGTFTYNDNLFHQVVYVITTSSYTIYADGVQVATGALSGTVRLWDSATQINIGQNGASDHGYFNGSIESVAVFNRALSGSEILSHYQAVTQSPLRSNLDFWPLSDAAGSTTAVDTVGSLPLTVHGTVTFGATGPQSSKAATFDGSTGYLASASPPSSLPIGAEPWTVEAWFLCTAVPSTNFAALLSYGNYGNTGQILAIGVRSDGKTVTIEQWAFDVSWTRSTSYIDGNWHYFVATFDSKTRKIYFDGSLMNSDTPSGMNVQYGSNPLQIGWGYSADAKFTGSIARARISNYAFSDASILSNYIGYPSSGSMLFHL